jgi:hypothetical protein
MKPIKIKVTHKNSNAEIILFAENENHAKEFIKIVSGFALNDENITFPIFSQQEIDNFKKNVNYGTI